MDINKNSRARTHSVGITPNSAGVIQGLFDFRFSQYITMQLLPMFYVLLLMGAAVAIIAVVALCFWLEPIAGLIALLLAPLFFLIVMAIIRAALEYLVMAHRIMRIIEHMDNLPVQVSGVSSQVDTITCHVNRLITHVDYIHATLTEIRPLVQIFMIPHKVKGLLRGSLKRKVAQQ